MIQNLIYAQNSDPLNGVNHDLKEWNNYRDNINPLKEFEKLAEKKDFDSVMNSMMKQLLSKEIMYEPVKEITEKYPEWLAENERKLYPKEFVYSPS